MALIVGAEIGSSYPIFAQRIIHLRVRSAIQSASAIHVVDRPKDQNRLPVPVHQIVWINHQRFRRIGIAEGSSGSKAFSPRIDYVITARAREVIGTKVISGGSEQHMPMDRELEGSTLANVFVMHACTYRRSQIGFSARSDVQMVDCKPGYRYIGPLAFLELLLQQGQRIMGRPKLKVVDYAPNGSHNDSNNSQNDHDLVVKSDVLPRLLFWGSIAVQFGLYIWLIGRGLLAALLGQTGRKAALGILLMVLGVSMLCHTVLASPHHAKPLVEYDGGVLKDRADLDRELLAAGKACPEHPGPDERNPFTLTLRAFWLTLRPLRHRNSSRHTVGSEKYRIACIKPASLLSSRVSMIKYCYRRLCESSDLLPKDSRPKGRFLAGYLRVKALASTLPDGCQRVS